MRYYVLTGTTLKSNGFGSNVEIKVSVNSNFVDAENQLESEVVHTIEKDDFYNDSISKDTDENKEIKANIKKTFKKVYDRDIKKMNGMKTKEVLKCLVILLTLVLQV